MKTDHLAAALCTAALIRTRTDLDYRLRSLIISRIPPFDTRSPAAVGAGVITACQNAGLSFAPRGYTGRRIAEARGTAEDWISRGIFLVSLDRMVNSEAERRNLPPIFFAWGRQSVFERPAVSILNSRISRRITPADTWLAATKTLFRAAAETRSAVVSSYGSVPYCVVSRLASANGLPLIIVCEDLLPFMKSDQRLGEFLGMHGDLFDLERTLFLSPYPPGRMPPRRTRSSERDDLVAALSSRIMVAAVREGGTMEAITKRAARRRIRVTVFLPRRPDRSTAGNVAIIRDNSFRTIQTATTGAQPLPATAKTRGADGPPMPRRAVLSLRGWPEKGSCLIHYTRACPGPWPGQSMGAYCQSLIDDSEGSAHSGFDTLLRILEEEVIRASHRLTRGSVPVVSLTECLPDELERLIKWRRGLIRWSFEPYGIAVHKKPLLDLGAKPVIYGDGKMFSGLSDDRKHLFQIRKETGPDWSLEREWRLPGDFSLRHVPRDAITIVVASLTEAKVVHHQFDYEVTLAGIPRKVGSVGPRSV